MVAAQSLATSISLTWDQTEGAEAVDRYEISYSYVVGECVSDGSEPTNRPVTVTMIDGSQRSYNIMDSYATPVEEDSQYTISIKAINLVNSSVAVNVSTTTQPAGLNMCSKLFVKVTTIFILYSTKWSTSEHP